MTVGVTEYFNRQIKKFFFGHNTASVGFKTLRTLNLSSYNLMPRRPIRCLDLSGKETCATGIVPVKLPAWVAVTGGVPQASCPGTWPGWP